MAKSGRLELGDNILRTLQVYLQPALWRNSPTKQSNSAKTQNKGYYAVEGHSSSSRSVPIESSYIHRVSEKNPLILLAISWGIVV